MKNEWKKITMAAPQVVRVAQNRIGECDSVTICAVQFKHPDCLPFRAFPGYVQLCPANDGTAFDIIGVQPDRRYNTSDDDAIDVISGKPICFEA